MHITVDSKGFGYHSIDIDYCDSVYTVVVNNRSDDGFIFFRLRRNFEQIAKAKLKVSTVFVNVFLRYDEEADLFFLYGTDNSAQVHLLAEFNLSQ